MKVGLKMDGEKMIVKLLDKVDPGAFAAYRGAIREHGGTWDSVNRHNSIPLSTLKLDKLVASIQNAGFEVVANAADKRHYVAKSVDASAVEQKVAERIAMARERVAAIDGTWRDLQGDGIRWLITRMGAGENSLLADDMGLGKTMQILFAVDGGTAVVSPASLKFNWQQEAAIWRPDLRVTVLSGRDSFRWPERDEIVVFNYDILPGAPAPRGWKTASPERRAKMKYNPEREPALPEEPAFPVTIVADEAHALKNRKSHRFRRFRHMVKTAGGRAILATGTEMMNRPSELWTILDAVGLAGTAFSNWNTFVALFNGVRGSFGGHTWGTPDKAVVERLRRVSLKRRKDDYLTELPPFTRQDVSVEIDAKTRLLCDRVVAFLASKGIDIDTVTDTVQITKLVGAGFEEISAAMTALAMAKMSAAVDLVEQYEENDTPVLFFSAHRAPVEMVGSRPGWAIIYGSTKPEDRIRIKDDFQAGRLKGVAGTIKAMGMGLTLTHASHVIRLDREWTPALNNQASDRVRRMGQKAGVLVLRDLIANHRLDARLTEILTDKDHLIKRTTDAAAILPHEKIQYAQVGADPFAKVTFAEIGEPEKKTNGARKPKNAREEWAARALVTLSELDPDHAAVINNVGWSKYDGGFGKSLTTQMVSRGGLTDRQWDAAIRLCSKYWRQVGSCP